METKSCNKRSIFTEIEGTSGIPRGSLLGPQLLNTLRSDQEKRMERRLFATDGKFFRRRKNKLTAEKELQKDSGH